MDRHTRELRVKALRATARQLSAAQFAYRFDKHLKGDDAWLVAYHVVSYVEVLERSPGLATRVAGFDAAPG